MNDYHDFNARIVEEFRTHEGRVGGPFEGSTLLILHTTGARTGTAREHPMVYRPDGEDWLVFASKAGAPDNPDWFHNLKAHPEARIELGGAGGTGGIEIIDVRATELTGDERTQRYAEQAADHPGFADYQAKTDRVIPVVRLTRR